MGQVFAYNHHDGFDDDMFLKGHRLSDEERWCPLCKMYDELICEVTSFAALLDIIKSHGIELGSGEYLKLTEQFVRFSEKPLKGKDRMLFINHLTCYWLDDEVIPELKVSEDILISSIAKCCDA